MEKAQKPAREMRGLDELKPFPTQVEQFGDLNEVELTALAEDISANGLKHPIEVLGENAAGLPVGTIVCGHQRLRALRLLGVQESRVRVRYDLAGATRNEVEGVFLDDNVHRKQLTPLGKARAAYRRVELERGAGGLCGAAGGKDLRDRVGAAIGMTGRNVQRYLNALKAPAAVQRAFDAGDVTLVQADRVGQLGKKERQELTEAIDGGTPARKAVEHALRLAAPEGECVDWLKALSDWAERGERVLGGLGNDAEVGGALAGRLKRLAGSLAALTG